MREAHARGLKVILDFVPNHTSDEHPWFVESRSLRDRIRSATGTSGAILRRTAGRRTTGCPTSAARPGQFDESTRQYYYHAFLPEQPDLNWRNPEVVEAMLGVLRYWLDRDVDGFRVDVIWHLIKDAEFRDNPRNPTWTPDENPYHELLPVLHERPAGSARRDRADAAALRRVRRARADRRDLPADRAPRPLLR